MRTSSSTSKAIAALLVVSALGGCGSSGVEPATAAASVQVPPSCIHALDKADAALSKAAEGMGIVAEVLDSAKRSFNAIARGDVSALRAETAKVGELTDRLDVAGQQTATEQYRAAAEACRAGR